MQPSNLEGGPDPCTEAQTLQLRGLPLEPERRGQCPRGGERRDGSHSREAAERGKGIGAGLKAPGTTAEEADRESPEDKKEVAAKKKKKKKKKKSKERMTPVKSLEALFATTGLDPKEDVRRKLRKKAKRLGRRARSWKSSTGSSSSSSSSGSSTEEDGQYEELFTPLSAPQRIWRKYPGVLTATMLVEAQKVMMLQLGAGLREAEGRNIRPLVTQYCRQHLMASMAAPVAREALHWSAVLDLLLEGRVASAMAVTEEFRRAEQVNASRFTSPTRAATPGSRGSGIVDRSSHGRAGSQSRGQGSSQVDEQAMGGEIKRQGQRREGQVERQQGRQQVHRARQEQEGEGRREKEDMMLGVDGRPRGGLTAPLVEAPRAYEVDFCMEATGHSAGSGEAGDEFNSSGKTATLNDGEPLDLTANISPGQEAELSNGLSKPGEDQDLDGSTMAAIFKRAVEVLRTDKHPVSRRSNTEPSQGPRCPLFPLRIRQEGWGSRLGFTHLPRFDALVNGTLTALNHLAGYECTQSSSQDEVAASATSSETSVRSLAEKGWWRSSFAIACGRFRIVLFHLVSFS